MNAAIEEARHRKFKWGEHDCVLFAAGVVERLTGIDHAAAWRGTYTDEIGAYRKLRTEGGMFSAVSARLGNSVQKFHAQRGDVVAFDTAKNRPALGICIGTHCAFAGKEGLSFVKLGECIQAWHV